MQFSKLQLVTVGLALLLSGCAQQVGTVTLPDGATVEGGSKKPITLSDPKSRKIPTH